MSDYCSNRSAMKILLILQTLQSSLSFTTTTTTQFPKTFQTKTTTPQNQITPIVVSSTKLKSSILDDLFSPSSSKTKEEIEKENKPYLESLQTKVNNINELEATIEELDDDELQAKTVEFRERLKNGEDVLTSNALIEEAFAVVREASWRVLELRHYDVQLLGGLILHDGRLAEMATGEGKTLVATLPCYLNALDPNRKYPVFVVTVNDYLARRDAEKMGQIHRYLGLKVGCIQSDMDGEERKRIYEECDIVYVTNSELGFDYLRDHLALSIAGTVLPSSNGGDDTGISEFNGFCIVDEADSVLIDEARTPLIISKQVPAPETQYSISNQIAGALEPKIHYDIDFKNKNVVLNERGYRDCERALNVDSLFFVQKGYGAWAPYIQNAVKAKELFEKDVDYTVVEDEKGEKVGVGIIDAFTGRVLDGRRWSDGLHQSIEAKEGISVSSQSKVIAKITYQSLFRQFTRLSGMTGTATSDAIEFDQVYDLPVTPVPTALPVARRDYPDVIFKSRKAGNKALINEILALNEGEDGGRPVLIGTTSIAASEVIVKELKERGGIDAEILNALPKNAARESEIIAQAGRAGVVTVATNMAGRGTDILLGGCPSTMAKIRMRSILVPALGAAMKEQELEKIPPSPKDSYYPTNDIPVSSIDLIQSAGKEISQMYSDMTTLQLEDILSTATDTTEAEDDPSHIIQLREAYESIVNTYKPILDEEKEVVRSKGGLYVMGTTRHESSRIDDQLRGRSGRQGDPGSSRFFLSFEDDIFVIFGGDGLNNILETFRVSEDMPVEAPQVSKSLDKVQLNVEEKYRDIRSQILEFDLVLEGQRRVIYARRQKILFSDGEETLGLIQQYHSDSVRDIVQAQISDGAVDTGKIFDKIVQFFPPVANILTKEDLEQYKNNPESILSYLNLTIEELFKLKISQKEESSIARSANYILLVSIDNAWSDHLQNMENLKESVVLRKYQQLDPVAEYKSEAFEMFKGLEDAMRLNAIYSLWQSL